MARPAVQKRRPHAAAASVEAGFLLVDAVVALLVLSTLFLSGFAALQTTQGLESRAEEARQANLLIGALLWDGPRVAAPSSGVDGPFNWRLQMTPTAVAHPVAICNRTLELTHRRSGRVYQAATQDTCPALDP